MCNKKRKSLLFYIFRPMGSTNSDHYYDGVLDALRIYQRRPKKRVS